MTRNEIAKNFPELCMVGEKFTKKFHGTLHRYAIRGSMLLTPCNMKVGKASPIHLYGFDEAEGLRRCPRCFPQ